MRFLALSALVFGLPPFHSAIRPLGPPERAQLIGEFWHAGCPVPLSSLSLLTVSHWDFAGNVQTGQLVVNRRAAAPLARVLRRLYGHALSDPAYDVLRLLRAEGGPAA